MQTSNLLPQSIGDKHTVLNMFVFPLFVEHVDQAVILSSCIDDFEEGLFSGNTVGH